MDDVAKIPTKDLADALWEARVDDPDRFFKIAQEMKLRLRKALDQLEEPSRGTFG